MKKILFLAIVCSTTIAFSQTTVTTYTGNGKNNFGGAVGEGSLTITENPDSVSFSLTKGPGLFDSLIVFYLDIQEGGISSTSVLAGSSTDSYLAAVSGNSPARGNAVLNFPDDFQPDGAVVFNKDSGRIFYFVTLPIFGTTVIPKNSFKVSAAGNTFIAGSSKADLQLSGPLNFKFLGTYIGKSASRSNEAFGDLFDDYLRPAGTAGYNPYTVKTYFTFTSGVLPVKLVDFKAAKEGDMVNIYWLVTDETGIDTYEVQRSTDGIHFSTIESFKARNSATSLSYSTKDVSAPRGINYYRLIITERGQSQVSKVISLNMKVSKNNFIASCSPGKTLNITLNEVNAGAYKLHVINNNGQIVQTENLKVYGSYQNAQIQLKQNLKGIYRLSLRSATSKYAADIFVQ